MKKIYLICDYLNRFSYKWGAKPYLSGMNKTIIKEAFYRNDYKAIYLTYPKVNFLKNWLKDDYFLYTSSQDSDLFYKSYIEDIILGLEIKGAKILPPYLFLRAHHNKVFMEIIRNIFLQDIPNEIYSTYFGTLEDLSSYCQKHLSYPVVIKSAFGAGSKFIRKAHNYKELYSIAKRFSFSPNLFNDLWDLGRKIKRKGYMRGSRYRKKFIIQSFVSNLPNDWKILIYGSKYYILERKNRKNDFRASGSGLLSYPDNIPDGLLDFAKLIFNKLNIPFLSLDIGHDGNSFHLIEFQALNFGTHTLETSPYYYQYVGGKGFNKVTTTSSLEDVFVNSVIEYINRGFTK